MALSARNRVLLNKMNRTAQLARLGDAVNIQFFDSSASPGGSATVVHTVTGLGANDEILSVTPRTQGANAASVRSFGTQINNGLTVVYTADPGAGAVVRVAVLKAPVATIY